MLKFPVSSKINIYIDACFEENVPLRELCPKKMSQREENARINTADDLEQFGHNCGSFN